MSLIKCGTDENGSYIELRKPRGETPPCFIDECGVVHDTIRIYEYTLIKRIKLQAYPLMSTWKMLPHLVPLF